jgi:hypothetical protein
VYALSCKLLAAIPIFLVWLKVPLRGKVFVLTLGPEVPSNQFLFDVTCHFGDSALHGAYV